MRQDNNDTVLDPTLPALPPVANEVPEVPADPRAGAVPPPLPSTTSEAGVPKVATAPQARGLDGTVIEGKYRIERFLAEGGMGRVYVATHLRLRKQVVVKVLSPSLSGNARYVEQLEHEARANASLDHPGIVKVSDLGKTTDGMTYVVMELLEGSDLKEEIDRCGKLPVGRAVRIALAICDAMAYAHRKGVLHRDLKPANVFVIPDEGGEDVVKIVDFGMARNKQDLVPDMLKRDSISGTPAYMSPEQAACLELDERTDVYSLGAILYQMLTSELTHPGTDVYQMLEKKSKTDPRPVRELNPEVSDALAQVVHYALARDRDQRIGSMRKLADRLRQARDATPSPQPVVTRQWRLFPKNLRRVWELMLILFITAILCWGAQMNGGEIPGDLRLPVPGETEDFWPTPTSVLEWQNAGRKAELKAKAKSKPKRKATKRRKRRTRKETP